MMRTLRIISGNVSWPRTLPEGQARSTGACLDWVWKMSQDWFWPVWRERSESSLSTLKTNKKCAIKTAQIKTLLSVKSGKQSPDVNIGEVQRGRESKEQSATWHGGFGNDDSAWDAFLALALDWEQTA